MIINRPKIPKAKIRLKDVCLLLGTFFNPLGFDALFALVMKWTGSFIVTDIIFYCTSILFFLLYYYLSKRDNPKNSQDGIQQVSPD